MLGDPLSHSRSPAIHRAALELAGISGVYTALRTTSAQLGKRLASLKAGQYNGFNLTMPLKERSVGLVDELTCEAAQSGSVNTVRLCEGNLQGHSTDVSAFETLLSQPRFSELPMFVLGSGGSARAALQAANHTLTYLSARSDERADNLRRSWGPPVEVVPWGTPVAGAVVVNCTPVGMDGERLPTGVVEAGAGLIDLPYGRGVTPAAATAHRLGIPLCDGYEFLALQAAYSFTWWTGTRVDFRPLADVARNV